MRSSIPEVLKVEVDELHDDEADSGEVVEWDMGPGWDDFTRKGLISTVILVGKKNELGVLQSRGVYTCW